LERHKSSTRFNHFFRDQGDQIGRISDKWEVAYFGQIFENHRSSPRFLATCYLIVDSCINFDKKVVWASFWAIFSQAHLVTLFGMNPPRLEGVGRGR
jgi:hypothetical protein